ncbi:MAG: hypothetical protein P9M06_06520 [Candidatus Saelkia tenebricola]|nr:hypothetical protein [Candidatus Saelkia tenebricola]
MRNKRWYFLKIVLLLFVFLFKSHISSAEILLTIIGEDKKISQGFIENIEKYLPDFEYVYYNHKDVEIQNTLKELSLPYLPVIIYEKDKLDSSEKDVLEKKRLIVQKGDYYIFSPSRLHYITRVRFLNRKRIPDQLGIFVMSMCPYGQRVQWQVIEFIKGNQLPVELEEFFIADIENGKINSMRGPDEVEENIHQILIEKYWPQKLYDYLLLTKDISHFEALKKAGISYNRLDRLREEGKELLEENMKVAQELDVHVSPTFLWENIYLISGLDKIMEILESIKVREYSKTHPKVEYKIVGLENYELSQNIFTFLKENFRLKGTFIPFTSSLAGKYIEKFGVDYLPFIWIKKDDDLIMQKVLSKKNGWEEKEDGFVMLKDRVLEISPIHCFNREEKNNQIDIIANKKQLNVFRDSLFIEVLADSGIKVNFHSQGVFSKSKLYKELGVKKLPVILWENQYLVANFRQLLMLSQMQERFKNLESDRKIVLDFFSSPSCKFCRDVEDGILPHLLDKYRNLIDVVKFDTSQPRKYKFFLRMEENFNADREGVPKIFLGGEFLIGKNEIESELEMRILNALIGGEHIFEKPSLPVKVDYFYNSSHVQKNENAKYILNELVPSIEERYKDKIKITKYEITKKENFDYMTERTRQALIKEDYFTPKIFIADNLMQGADEIGENLDLFIQEELLASFKEQKEDIFFSKISKFTLPTVITAGLLDGINPCAFTVIVFFISFLATAQYKKRQMLYVGTFFILAVFLTYSLIGLGLFSVFYKLQIYEVLFDSLRYVLIGIVFLLAVFNLYDYVIYKLKKTPQSLILKLPHKIKFLIQKTIGKGYRIKDGEDEQRRGVFKLVIVAMIVGFVVSILESVCTGQIYFPTVAFLVQLPGIMRVKALAYLLLYNLMFIIPLVVIFLLGLAGVSSEQFTVFIKKHLGRIKLFSALLFFFLGYILIVL